MLNLATDEPHVVLSRDEPSKAPDIISQSTVHWHLQLVLCTTLSRTGRDVTSATVDVQRIGSYFLSTAQFLEIH